MTIDIVDRLRDYYTDDEQNFCVEHPICFEAADEIERLRGLLKLADGKLEALTGEPHIDGWPLHSGLPPGPSAAASGLQPERSDRMDKD